MSPSWDDVKVGDTVSFVVTGEVLTIDEAGGAVANESGEIAFIVDSDVLKSVEKPVVTFKPGDIVKIKGGSGKTPYVVTETGARYLLYGTWYESSEPEIDSTRFELI